MARVSVERVQRRRHGHGRTVRVAVDAPCAVRAARLGAKEPASILVGLEKRVGALMTNVPCVRNERFGKPRRRAYLEVLPQASGDTRAPRPISFLPNLHPRLSAAAHALTVAALSLCRYRRTRPAGEHLCQVISTQVPLTPRIPSDSAPCCRPGTPPTLPFPPTLLPPPAGATTACVLYSLCSPVYLHPRSHLIIISAR